MKNKIGFFDKQSFLLFVVALSMAYLIPGNFVYKFEVVGNYVHWFMGVFPVFEYISLRSIDPNSYRLFFSMIVWCIPIFAIAYYKKPLEFNMAKFYSNKIFFLFGWFVFMPLMLIGGAFSFHVEIDSRTFFIFKKIIDITIYSKLILAFMFGSVVCFYSFVIAGIFTSIVRIREFL